MFSTSVVDAAAGWLSRRTSRRSFLQRAALAGSALTVGGLDYVLRPGSAYASICGSGASCASGWTALCCTINNGVNQCPPGAFAAGWWKADGVNLCGGKARYYVDCQARCTDCGCPRGSHYCAERCWNCRPKCSHSGTCDERRVCSNVFRYGQCRQDIHCSGPVWCRVISCTPPWKWEACSRSSATDNNTRSHSAPCLPTSWSPIQKRYAALGSQSSPLGATDGREREGHRGRVQHFVGGRMYHSEHTGTHYLLGSLAAKYAHLGESRSALGLPTIDTRHNGATHGRHNDFEHGAIYDAEATGTHAVIGTIYQAWDSLGRTGGPLGRPVTDTAVNIDGHGRHSDFEHGAIYTHPAYGTHVVPKGVVAVWPARERGPLGYPTGDLSTVADGQRMTFAGGVVDVHPDAGTHAVWGPIFVSWTTEHGGEDGTLGFPTTSVYAVDATHDRCDFQNGSLVLDTTTGEVTQV